MKLEGISGEANLKSSEVNVKAKVTQTNVNTQSTQTVANAKLKPEPTRLPTANNRKTTQRYIDKFTSRIEKYSENNFPGRHRGPDHSKFVDVESADIAPESPEVTAKRLELQQNEIVQ